MHTIKLKIDDSIYNYIMFLLKNLKVKGLEIEEEENIDFSKFKIDSFKKLDPIKFQKEIRDEWR
jgi:hypothetical protein